MKHNWVILDKELLLLQFLFLWSPAIFIHTPKDFHHMNEWIEPPHDKNNKMIRSESSMSAEEILGP